MGLERKRKEGREERRGEERKKVKGEREKVGVTEKEMRRYDGKRGNKITGRRKVGLERKGRAREERREEERKTGERDGKANATNTTDGTDGIPACRVGWRNNKLSVKCPQLAVSSCHGYCPHTAAPR